MPSDQKLYHCNTVASTVASGVDQISSDTVRVNIGPYVYAQEEHERYVGKAYGDYFDKYVYGGYGDAAEAKIAALVRQVEQLENQVAILQQQDAHNVRAYTDLCNKYEEMIIENAKLRGDTTDFNIDDFMKSLEADTVGHAIRNMSQGPHASTRSVIQNCQSEYDLE
jgi:hypothetical protein